MLMGMGTMVSAAEKESSIPEYSETNDGGMTVNIAGDQEGTIVEGSGNEEGINPLWWPGDGPAPQVTSISLYKYGWLTNGNFGVTIKVYGYGSDTTTFDGRSISWIHQEPFIISGTGADGFYYTYDCGTITQAGSYRFKCVLVRECRVYLNYLESDKTIAKHLLTEMRHFLRHQ